MLFIALPLKNKHNNIEKIEMSPIQSKYLHTTFAFILVFFDEVFLQNLLFLFGNNKLTKKLIE